MGKFKLVAIDIGGTLLTDDNKISEENIQTLKKVKELGIIVVLITARMYSSTKYISNVINADYGVYGNGGNVIDINNITEIKSDLISKKDLERLIDFGKKEKLYIHLNEVLYEASDERKYFALKHILLNENYPDKLKSNIRIVDNLSDYISTFNDFIKVIYVSEKIMDCLKTKIEVLFPNLHISEYSTNLYESVIGKTINYIEIGSKHCTKAEGLIYLLKHINVNPSEVLVIGDGNNDIEMFKYFENSGCLINGSSEAKKYAGYISEKSNNESGVSEIINYYVKGLIKK